MSVLTPKQRTELERRVALAIGWDLLQAYQRDNAKHTARLVVDELERIHGGAALGRRGVVAIVEQMERSA